MIAVENISPVQNINPQANLLHNRWVLNNDFVFTLVTPTYHKRIVVPAKGADFKRLKPRRIRAELVHQALKLAHQHGALISHRQRDTAYLQVLKQDGCGAGYRLFRLAGLTLKGSVTKLWGYWAVPKASAQPQEPSVD